MGLFTVVEHGGLGWLSQMSQLAWMLGGIVDVSKSSTNIFLCKWTERRGCGESALDLC